MVNTVKCYVSTLHKLMKLVGMQPIKVEIDSETIIHFWVNNNNNNNNKNNKKEKKKPPVVLIHGFTGDGILTWHFQVLALRKHFSLFIPDLLFFGGSHTSKPDRTPKFQAESIAKGLRKLGVEEKCAVVGLSYGGFVVFQMAEHHPELVGTAVVNGATLAMTESISKEMLKRVGFSSWPEFFMPTSPKAVKVQIGIGSYSFPWMPMRFYKDYHKLTSGNRKEREELLEALVIKDEDVTTHKFEQRIHLLWGKEDSIFDLEIDGKNLEGKIRRHS